MCDQESSPLELQTGRHEDDVSRGLKDAEDAKAMSEQPSMNRDSFMNSTY